MPDSRRKWIIGAGAGVAVYLGYRWYRSRQGAAASTASTAGGTIPPGGTVVTNKAAPTTLAAWQNDALQFGDPVSTLNAITNWLAGNCVDSAGFGALSTAITSLGLPPGLTQFPVLTVCPSAGTTNGSGAGSGANGTGSSGGGAGQTGAAGGGASAALPSVVVGAGQQVALSGPSQVSTPTGSFAVYPGSNPNVELDATGTPIAAGSPGTPSFSLAYAQQQWDLQHPGVPMPSGFASLTNPYDLYQATGGRYGSAPPPYTPENRRY